MAKSLVIVESPAKARTIGRYLGRNYVVKASMGHVRDLPRKAFGVDVEHDFKPTYRVLPTRRKAVGQLKKAAQGAEAVYLATDLDREGEAIAWHLCHALKVPVEKAYRVVFNQITAAAVRSAFRNPGRIDPAKVNAQQARRILDRIVGYKLSPLLWRTVAKGLSAGRVQSVAVRLVVEREREIAGFQPEEYWKITATLAPLDRKDEEEARFSAELTRWKGERFRAARGEEAHAVVEALREADYAVQSLEVKERSEAPPPPFTTSTMQQQAATQLRMSTRRTMRVAQQLYEGLPVGDEGEVGLITYMRTDSVHVAPEALAACREFIAGRFGEAYLPAEARRFRQRAGAQAAHEAIRPTDVGRTPESLEGRLDRDQHRLYALIWRRFVASQMAPARYENTTARVVAGEGLFTARGRRVLFDGFRRLAGFPRGEVQLLPALAEGEALHLVALEPTQHFTEPPPRYTEASLVRTLEREGIGRPSTYAPIVATIQERGYVKLVDRRFHATELGMLVTDLLVKHFERVMDLGFTRHMESELDRIEEGRIDWVAVLREFYEPFKAALDDAAARIKEIKAELTRLEGETCPKCGRPLAYRWSRYGRFIGCTGYPACDYVRRPAGEEQQTPAIDEACPLCGKPLAVKRSRYGPFVGCTGFPECRYTRRLAPAGKSSAAGGAPSAPADRPDRPGRAGRAEEGDSPRRSERQARAEAVLAAATGATSPSADGAGESRPSTEEPAPCEKCGAPMVLRRSRCGPFLGCSAYPKCRNTRPLEKGRPAAEAEGVTCPECSAPMVLRRGRRGPFLGCSRYPDCRGTRTMRDAGGEKDAPAGDSPDPPSRKSAEKARKKRKPRKTGVACPRKGCDGELVERRGRTGKFFGCSNFPECTYTTNDLPAEEDGEKGTE